MASLKRIGRLLAKIIILLAGLALLLAVIGAVVFFRVNQTNGKLTSSGQEREYYLYVPPSYDPSAPTPLVISIHGFAEWPAHQMQISRWNTLADQYGFLVVYPSGTQFPKRWKIYNEGGTESDFLSDVQFISDLIDHLEQEYNIDETRIYANGLSNGGGMSVLLACRLSDRIAAVGSVSGAFLLLMDECNPEHPVPLIAFHGTADPIVPYEGGPSSSFDLPFPAVSEWIEAWASRNGCSLPPVVLPIEGDASGVRYTRCDENAEVVFYTIEGGGHSWPGGEPLPGWIVGTTTQDINATELIWQFFTQYSLSQ